VHQKIPEKDIQLGISPKILDVIIKYLGGISNHIQRKVIPFNPRQVMMLL
jgi:hypothetical protein